MLEIALSHAVTDGFLFQGEIIMPTYHSHEVIIENSLSIYQLNNTKKKFWYVHAKIPNHHRERRSLKTTHRDVAIKMAKEFYYKLLELDEKGLDFKHTSWTELVTMYQDARMYSDTTKHRLKMITYYFKRFDNVRTIDALAIGKWIAWRKVFWTSGEGKKYLKVNKIRGGRHKFSNISARTLRMESVAIRGVLLYAKEKGIISSVPDIATLQRKRQYKETKQHRRGAITQSQHQRILKKLNDDYRKLRKSQNTQSTMRTHARTAGRVYQQLPIRKNRRLWAYVHLLNHSGLRVSECLRLRWRHIIKRHHYERDLPIIEINIDETISKVQESRKVLILDTSLIKTGESHLQKVLDDWRELSPCSDDNDFIFCNVVANGRMKPNRKTANAEIKGAMMDYYFSKFIHNILSPPIHTDSEGKEITSTSYRHKWATEKITQGVPTAIVAQLMGSSEIQLKNHYSHLLTWHIKDVVLDAVEKSVHSKEALRRKANVVDLIDVLTNG